MIRHNIGHPILEPIALHLLARQQRRADLNREIKSCSGKTCRSIYLPCASKWNLRPLFDTAPAKQLIVGDHDFEMDFSSLWPALACLGLPLAHTTGSKPLWSRISIFNSPRQFHNINTITGVTLYKPFTLLFHYVYSDFSSITLLILNSPNKVQLIPWRVHEIFFPDFRHPPPSCTCVQCSINI